MINNTLSIGIQGVQQGMLGAENAARKIARAGTDGPAGTNDNTGANSLVEPMVELKLYQRSVEASSQVVKTADEMLGTLLDERA